MSKSKRISTAQIRELIALRNAGADVERELAKFVSPPRNYDLADVIKWVLERERREAPMGDRVQELITRLTSGGLARKMTTLREIAAKRLFDRRFGKAVGAKSFEDYLEDIPEIPASLLEDDSDLPLLSLADPYPGLTRACQFLNIRFDEFGYSDLTAVPFDQRFVLPTKPFWFRHDNGRKNRKRRPNHCRNEVTGDILVATAMEAVFAYAHHPDIVVEGEHAIGAPGSVLCSRRGCCARLEVLDGQAELDLFRDAGFAHPRCGSLRVRRK